MDAGDTDVVHAVGGAAHELGGDRGLLGDRDIGRAGATDDDAGTLRLARAIKRDAAGVRVVDRVGQALLHRAICFDVGARDEHAVALRSETLGDSRDLLRRLALAEDDLRVAGAQRAVVINAGEAEVFVRQVTQAGECVVRADIAAVNGFEHLFQALFVDGWPPL